MTKAFAFLVLEEHPYGREMLRRLLARDLVPALVVEERSELADVERGKFLERLAGFEIAPTFAEQLARTDARLLFVENHNSTECAGAIEDVAPDLIVLGGTRILRPCVFDGALDGCLNSHPGLLPAVRGSASVAWAVERDLPIGCTCHFIDARIDQGPIVSTREIPVHRGDSYERLCWLTVGLSGELMADAVEAWLAGALESRPQPSEGETHRNMPDAGVFEVKRKLAAGEYSHFVD